MSLQRMDHSQMFMSFSKASEVLSSDHPGEQTERLMKLRPIRKTRTRTPRHTE